MILKDLLTKNKPIQVMHRCNTPFPDIDTLFGYCYWNGETLESLDGDAYYLDDEIEKYEYWDDMLVVWFKAKWIGGENDD
jgi:hypothetical protein